MAWVIEWDERAARELRKLSSDAGKRILRYMRERVGAGDDPRSHGKSLAGNFAGLWRYRIGDYRAICRIEDERLVILVVAVGHRSDIYDR